MKHAEKNRDPEKARKRAKNDARTALRKLLEWAADVGDASSVELAGRALADVERIASRLSLTVEPSGSRDVWHVYRDGKELGCVEPHAGERSALADARDQWGVL